jgi:cytidylate kinase
LIIILEGPDGSGKTTLAKKIAKRFDGNRIHTGGKMYTSKEFHKRVDYLITLSKGSAVNVIDRVPWISEMVYSKALSREPLAPEHKMLKLMKIIRQKVIYCRPSTLSIDSMIVDPNKTHKSREFYETIKSNYPKIVDGYDNLFSMTLPFRHIKYDHVNDHLSKVYNFIKDE